ncbi:MAG: decaprenyl-phosphate phosphoribosyltransferase [Acidimicrobiales bacterium]
MTISADAVDTPDKQPARANPPAGPSLLVGVVRVARPRQWIKNLLVFVAPGAAGVLLHPTVLWHTVAAFGIFCLAASGTYFLNDALDAEADRRHPTKASRPVASGVVPVPAALFFAFVLVGASVGLAQLLAGWHLTVVMAVYGLVNLAYSLGLKHEPILDLAAVSAGYVLRAVAGGVATGVPLTDWFLIVALFGSLLVVTGKRSGERQLLDDEQIDHGAVRQTLGLYSPTFLHSVRVLAGAVTMTAYCLWAFDRAATLHPGRDPIWFELTIIPFTIALLHVMRLLDSGQGGTPEDLALKDHRLQIYGVVWVALFITGIYAT